MMIDAPVPSTNESKTDDAVISKLTENSSKIVYNISTVWSPVAAGAAASTAKLSGPYQGEPNRNIR